MPETIALDVQRMDSDLLQLDALAFVRGGVRNVAHGMLIELKRRDESMVEEVLDKVSAEDRKYFLRQLNM